MQQSDKSNRTAMAFFASSVAWYVSLLISVCVTKFHVASSPPEWLYRMYWSAYYDETGQHVFYILFVALGVLFGFITRAIPPISSTRNISLVVGTMASVLVMPLAAVGIQGVSLARPWPSELPPIPIYGGTLWCIPGLMILGITLYRTIRPDYPARP
jgi:hypothetical protein